MTKSECVFSQCIWLRQFVEIRENTTCSVDSTLQFVLEHKVVAGWEPGGLARADPVDRAGASTESSFGRAPSPAPNRTTNLPMDAAALSESLNGPQAYVLLATAAITTLFFFTWYTFDSEAAVDYSVEPPEQCSPGWKGRVLDEPSLKVRFWLQLPAGT